MTHHKLAAADVAARARGVHILTQAGIERGPRARAGRVVGVIWLLRTSEVDLPELDAETTAQARAMAGEKAVALTKDRTNILIACGGGDRGVRRPAVLPGPGWIGAGGHDGDRVGRAGRCAHPRAIPDQPIPST